MSSLIGVYLSKKTDGSLYFRSSITYNNKHISLGSYSLEEEAHMAYNEAKAILSDPSLKLNDYHSTNKLSFHKWVVLHNFRDNGYYIKNPIYLYKYYFSYFLSEQIELKFDVDDLFYYSNHKIFKRNGYLFVNDYGMQTNILSRYGIKNYAVEGKDYRFKDGDSCNYRYYNLEVINPYYGVSQEVKKGKIFYQAKIHINGDYIIGRYTTLEEAAVAYNKAVDYLLSYKGINKNYTKNYIETLNCSQYKMLYDRVPISHKIKIL